MEANMVLQDISGFNRSQVYPCVFLLTTPHDLVSDLDFLRRKRSIGFVEFTDRNDKSVPSVRTFNNETLIHFLRPFRFPKSFYVCPYLFGASQ